MLSPFTAEGTNRKEYVPKQRYWRTSNQSTFDHSDYDLNFSDTLSGNDDKKLTGLEESPFIEMDCGTVLDHRHIFK